MNLELHPLGQPRRRGQARQAHRFGGIHRAAGIGQEEIFLGIDEIEDIGVGIVLAGEIGAAQGHRDDLRAAGLEALGHRLVGGKLARAHEQP